MADKIDVFSPELQAWLDAQDKPKGKRIAKTKRRADVELSLPRSASQQIHAMSVDGGVVHEVFTVENWVRMYKDPSFKSMFTHPTDRCETPQETVAKARKEAGLS